MKITVEQGAKRSEIDCIDGQTILDALVQNGIAINAVCGGNGKCGRCRVRVRDANGTNWVLACQEHVSEGIVVAIEQEPVLVIQEQGSALPERAFPLTECASGYGVAVDIGTTTLVTHLHRLSDGARLATVSRTNPQVVFGADVISRITASTEGQLGLMCERIRSAISAMRKQLCDGMDIEVGDCTKFAIVGNTVMEHIFAGLPPDTIGVNPFTPLTLFGDVREIEGLGTCYFAPALAGYVGGDITAGLLARGYDHKGEGEKAPRAHLYLDMGTNGEMALEWRGRIAACATAAGPVFEGACIDMGMPASPGAISHIRFENGKFVLSVIGDDAPIGLCGTGVVDAVAVLLDCGVIDESGYMLDADELEEPFASHSGVVNDRTVFYLTDDRSVYLSQGDVRNMQLAKAAVCAGVFTLMEHLDVDTNAIESVEIAGGFGAFLDPASAARIGLYPRELKELAKSVGNAAAEGASALLVSEAARQEIAELVAMCEYIELSTSQEFNEHYIEQMGFDEE